MLACEWDNVKPDIILLGKALSGGRKFSSSNFMILLSIEPHLSSPQSTPSRPSSHLAR